MRTSEISELVDRYRRKKRKVKIELNLDGSGMDDCKVYIRHLELKPEDLSEDKARP